MNEDVLAKDRLLSDTKEQRRKEHLHILLDQRRETWLRGIKDKARGTSKADVYSLQMLAMRLQELDDICALLNREDFL